MTELYVFRSNELSIGRLKPCHVVCKDCLEMSGKHIVIRRVSNSKTIEKYELVMEGKNGGYINGHFIRRGDVVEIEFGDEITVYDVSLIWMNNYVVLRTDAEIEVMLEKYDSKEIKNEETVDETPDDISSTSYEFFSKAPRPQYSLDGGVIELEAPPDKHFDDAQPMFMTIGPAFTMALPMLFGFLVSRMASKSEGVMSSAFMYTGLITAISSATIGSVWGIMNLKNRRAKVIKQEVRRKTLYTEYVMEAEEKIKERYNKNVSTLRLKYPDISEYLSDDYNKFILWNRSPNDMDYLSVRLGMGNIYRDFDFTIPKDKFSLVEDELRNLPKRLKQQYSILRDVPITANLSAQKCSGIVSESRRARDDIFLQIIMGLSVTIFPEELKIAIILDKEGISNEAVKAVRFLPHLSHINKALVALNAVKAIEIISNLNQITEDDSGVRIIIFTDCYEKIAGKVNDTDEIRYITISENFENLPSNCRLIIQKNAEFSGTIRLTYENAIRTAVHFDMISISEASKYSRILQGIRIKTKKDKGFIPTIVSFYELFGKVLDDSDIKGFWDKNSTIKEIVAPVGIGEDGEILTLNLHENGLGPHGLIAGMTGSGKSEILQTIILSLAVMYSPMDVGFFLIDYKGGGMADLFHGIPHVLGCISNLSGQMINRAMASVKSENERRQRVFAKYKVNNISEYQKCFKAGIIREPMPHVFIIIDEFAELKREEPEFLSGLISVARVGRSLGIHLILATQKPTGVVDDNIQSNSRFRICLKLQDKSDSMEMLHKPDAAFISNTGRAILQVGNDEVYMPFQGAYTMSRKTNVKHRSEVYITNDIGETIECVNTDYDKEAVQENEGEPQLKIVTNQIQLIAKAYDTCRIPPLWLEPLPDNIAFDREYSHKGNKYDICIGIFDDPSHQNQEKLIINLVKSGHHIILGGLQSGKSTLLATISFALLNSSFEDYVNLYYIDFSHGMLSPYKNFIYTGGYISEENEEDIEKLIILLKGIINERKELLKGGNFRQYIETTNEDIADLAAVFFIIDGFGTFRERTEGCFDKDIEYILKNGESLGIYVIASANSISSQEMPRRFSELFKVCLPLQLKDKYEYKEALNVAVEKVFMPENMRGRGLFKMGMGIVEFQSYQTVYAENDFERLPKIEKMVAQINEHLLCEQMKICTNRKKINRIPSIPKKLNLNSFIDELKRRNVEIINEIKGIPVGFFTKSGETFYLPYEPNLVVVITGKSGSGKTNLLNLIEYMSKELIVDGEYITADVALENISDKQKEYSEKDSKVEALFFSNGMRVFVYDERYPFEILAKMKALAGNDPYVIHLGGALDRQNFADYSYVPYSKQMQVLQTGKGIVRKTALGYQYGEVIFPER